MNKGSKYIRFFQWLGTSLVLLLAAACAAKMSPPMPPQAPPPAPTAVFLEIQTTGDINPNPLGRPSPLALRIYQLKSSSSFMKAFFMDLYEKDETVLGRDLVKKDEIILKVNENQNLPLAVEDDTSVLGLMAVFRDYEQSKWKATAAIIPHQPNRIIVHISGTTLTVK